MTKAAVLGAVALIAATASAGAETYVVDRWPGDIDVIPCSAWTRSADGAWVLHGSIKLGASVLDDIGVKGDASARLLDKRCGK